jgi:hypothetical protein
MKKILTVILVALSLSACDNRTCAEKGGKEYDYFVNPVVIPGHQNPPQYVSGYNGKPGYYIPGSYVPPVIIPGHMAKGCTK